MSPNSVWFWIVAPCGALVVAAVGRWVWVAVRDKFRLWVREPVNRAEERASVAADHAEQLNKTVGKPNGHGDLMSMLAKLLDNQIKDREWQRDIDRLVAETREDVTAIKEHLDL